MSHLPASQFPSIMSWLRHQTLLATFVSCARLTKLKEDLPLSFAQMLSTTSCRKITPSSSPELRLQVLSTARLLLKKMMLLLRWAAHGNLCTMWAPKKKLRLKPQSRARPLSGSTAETAVLLPRSLKLFRPLQTVTSASSTRLLQHTLAGQILVIHLRKLLCLQMMTLSFLMML